MGKKKRNGGIERNTLLYSQWLNKHDRMLPHQLWCQFLININYFSKMPTYCSLEAGLGSINIPTKTGNVKLKNHHYPCCYLWISTFTFLYQLRHQKTKCQPKRKKKEMSKNIFENIWILYLSSSGVMPLASETFLFTAVYSILQLKVGGPVALGGLWIFRVSYPLLVRNRDHRLDGYGALRHGFCWVSI